MFVLHMKKQGGVRVIRALCGVCPMVAGKLGMFGTQHNNGYISPSAVVLQGLIQQVKVYKAS